MTWYVRNFDVKIVPSPMVMVIFDLRLIPKKIFDQSRIHRSFLSTWDFELVRSAPKVPSCGAHNHHGAKTFAPPGVDRRCPCARSIHELQRRAGEPLQRRASRYRLGPFEASLSTGSPGHAGNHPAEILMCFGACADRAGKGARMLKDLAARGVDDFLVEHVALAEAG